MSTIPQMNTLRFEQDGHVARLTMNRPDKLNAFSTEMWDEMRDLGARLVADPGDIRALVLIGEGRAFSSGIDTSVFAERGDFGAVSDGATARDRDPWIDVVLRTQDAYNWLEEAPFATIAAVRGYALGAGLQAALACDIRVFAHGVDVGLLELKYGIMPDLGGTQRLTKLVGPGRAKEMILMGARIDGAEAYRLGICERYVPDEELETTVDAMAERIAAQPPIAVRTSKRAVEAATHLSLRDGLMFEATGQTECMRSEDMREAIGAFIEGRPPEYRNR
jgi:enoyl-CoA hydratase/carnithine racemase